MKEGISRRDFLKLGLATGAGLVLGETCQREERRDNKKESAGEKSLAEKSPELKSEEGIILEKEQLTESNQFLIEEIKTLVKGIEKKAEREAILAEFERIADWEKDKLLEKRFSQSDFQKEKYFAPLLARQKEIERIISEAEPAGEVPRGLLWGLLALEGGLAGKINQESGAAGPLQFTAETAKAMGMKVNKKVDERFDLKEATETAIKYLSQLYEQFGQQWGLALVAYSGGPSKLKRRLRRHFSLKKEEKFTPELFKEKTVNVVTLYSKKFKGLGKHHSVQYPFAVQIMAEWLEELINKKSYEIVDSRG